MYFKTREQQLQVYGQRIQRYRLQQNLTQVDLSKRSGVSLSTLRRIEQQGLGSMVDYLSILQALGLRQLLENLIPEPPISPKALFKQKTPRQRASKPGESV